MEQLQTYLSQIISFLENSRTFFPRAIQFVALFWLIDIINLIIFRRKLNFYLGLRPRSAIGLIGIFSSHFLHGDFNHLFLNSIFLLPYSLFILSYDLNMFLPITVVIMLLQGGMLWFAGRRGVHVGASGLTTGYFGFVFALAYFEPNSVSIFLSGLSLLYFSSIFWGIFPTRDATSWEGHLFGLIAGFASKMVYGALNI